MISLVAVAGSAVNRLTRQDQPGDDEEKDREETMRLPS